VSIAYLESQDARVVVVEVRGVQGDGQWLAVHCEEMGRQVVGGQVHVAGDRAHVQGLIETHGLASITRDVGVVPFQREAVGQHVLVEDVLGGAEAATCAAAVLGVGGAGDELLLREGEQLPGTQP